MSRRPLHIEDLISYQKIAEEMEKTEREGEGITKRQEDADNVEVSRIRVGQRQQPSRKRPVMMFLLVCICIAIVIDAYAVFTFLCQDLPSDRDETVISLTFLTAFILFLVYAMIEDRVMDTFTHYARKDKRETYILIAAASVFVTISTFSFFLLFIFGSKVG